MARLTAHVVFPSSASGLVMATIFVGGDVRAKVMLVRSRL
jgi:hypothetical protein